MSLSPSVRIIARQPIAIGQPEHREMMHYESGEADESARAISGGHPEPWLNVLELSRSSAATEICYTTGELHYLLQHAGFDAITYHPVDALTRGMIRKGMRRCLRGLGIEGIVRPPTYVIVARRS